jgi:hypothetical protein
VPDDNGSNSDGNACIHGDADGAAAAGSSGNAPESTQPQAQSSGAPRKHATRRRSQRAAASAASASMVQDDADLDAHADSVSDAIAETDASVDEEADAGADADAHAALPPGGASKRKRGRPRVAKRAGPAGKAGRDSVHGPGTYVHDVAQEACDSRLYTCGAVLMPAGQSLDPATYCNAALTCATPVESTLYNMRRVR